MKKHSFAETKIQADSSCRPVGRPPKSGLFSEKLTAVIFYGLILFIFFIFAQTFTYA